MHPWNNFAGPLILGKSWLLHDQVPPPLVGACRCSCLIGLFDETTNPTERNTMSWSFPYSKTDVRMSRGSRSSVADEVLEH